MTPTAVAHQFVYSPRYVDSPILDTQTTYTVVSGSWSSSINTYYFLTDANYNVTAATNSSGVVRSVTSIPRMEWRRSTTL